MSVQDHVGSSRNGSGTCQEIGTWLTHPCSLRVLRELRHKHGPTSAIGHRCSNIAELLKMPELPTHLIRRQMDDLQRLVADGERDSG